MAGEIQIGGTTFATESGGTVTVSNVDSDTNRQNLGLEIGVDVEQYDADTTKNDVANTFTANQIISVTDNTNAALRVTQLGTGNALVVEDSTNPDSSPFVVDASGNVGIGTTNPKSGIHINGGNLTFQQNYQAVLGNAYYSGGWKYAENGSAWAIGNNFGGPSNGFTIGHGPVNSSGNDAALTWTYAMGIDDNGYVLLGYTSSNGSYRLQVNSQIFAANGTIASSDGRYKENILPLDNGLAIVKALNPVQFDWKEHPVHKFDREQPNVGFIAQEVQEVLADKAYKNSIIKSNSTVITPEELDGDGNVITAEVTEEFLGIAEGNLIAILTKAIQEQQILIESQQSQIDALTARIEALETP